MLFIPSFVWRFFWHSTLLLTWLTFLGLLTQVLTSYDHILHSYFTLKGQFQNLTSGQVRSRSGQRQVTTGVGQYAYLPRRLDEPSRLAPFARLYLHPVVIYWQKQDFDLIWPQVTSPWPPIISCVLIITDGVSVHDSERIGWFRLVYVKREAFSYFLIGL